MAQHFGAPLRRFEDPRLLLGQAQFLEDLRLAGELHAAFVRSPFGHARLVGVDFAMARRVAGVLGVLGPAELGANPVIPVVIPQADLRDCQQRALAEGRVRYLGEPIALVVANDRYAAEDGAAEALLGIEFEPLAAVVEAEQALAEGAPQLHAAAPGNLVAHFGHAVGDADAAFDQAEVVVRGRFGVQRHTGMPIEPRGVLASFDVGTGHLSIWSSTQWPHTVRQGLCAALGLPESTVRVIAPDVGGGFGIKQEIYPEELAVALAAMRLGQPVKWVETRREHLSGSNHAREQVHDVELAALRDGTILGLRAVVTCDLGAYSRGLGALCPSITAGSLLGPYRIKHYAVDVRVAATNKGTAGAYRGAGGPEAVFALERAVDRLAEELGLDPAEVRRRNFIRPDEFPWDTGLGSIQVPVRYDSGDYPAALDLALDLADYAVRREEQAGAREQGRYFGIGVAAFVLLGGLGPYEGASVRMDGDGRVVLATGASPHGQGTATTLAQVVADALGIEPAEVTVQSGDTALIPYGIGTYASRNAVTAGSAAFEAARQVRQQVLRLSGRMLEAAPEDLELADGRITVKGAPDRSLALKAVAAAAAPEHTLPLGIEPGLEARHYFAAPVPTFSNGVHVAVVEVDAETGAITILDYVAVNDAGRLINPSIVDGQLHGGIAQGLGGALLEEIRYDEAGQLLTGSLMDYAMPTAHFMPTMTLAHLETPSPLNPLGVKGLGEGGVMAPPPAIAAAVEDALRPLGIRIDSTPLSAPRVRRLIEAVLERRPSTDGPPFSPSPLLPGAPLPPSSGLRDFPFTGRQGGSRRLI